MEKTLVVLAGPTAVGKTTCAIRMASHLGTEIISADSRQVYRETRIGTAVPSDKELSQVRHHFIQCTSIHDPYNASRFEKEALSILESLFSEHDQVIMAGGSGLYIEAVCKGIDDFPAHDPGLRAELRGRLDEEGLQPLFAWLAELDPESHQRIDLNNHMRVLKALEVTLQTGIPYSSFLNTSPRKRPFRIRRMALDMDRHALYKRINSRVDAMMEDGLRGEAESLWDFRNLTPLKSVGYRELFRYMDGELSLGEAVEQIKGNTRKFARKQLTWFRKDNLYTWFRPDQYDEMIRWIAEA